VHCQVHAGDGHLLAGSKLAKEAFHDLLRAQIQWLSSTEVGHT
jgi:hypothetical protein